MNGVHGFYDSDQNQAFSLLCTIEMVPLAHTHTHTHTHTHSKNNCGMGLASVVKNLSYSPSIEELILTAMTLRVGSETSALASALEKLFSLTASLKKVKLCYYL